MVDAQLISIATAVVSAAIAALGLLISWFRRDDRREERKSKWLFIAGCGLIVGLAAVGVVFTFTLGTDANNSPALDQLTEAEYRAQVAAVCSNAKEKARRLEELNAPSVFGSAIKVEEDQVNEIRRLPVPDKLKTKHEEMVSVWQRRISLLDSTYRRLPQLSDKEIRADLAELDRFAEQLARLFRSLGLQECVM